jgi:hypothetical protein
VLCSLQTGKALYTYDLGAGVAPGGGGVSLSDNGAWLAYTNGDVIYVLNGRTGALRATIQTVRTFVACGLFLCAGIDVYIKCFICCCRLTSFRLPSQLMALT